MTKMMNRKTLLALALISSSLLITGCDTMRHILGTDHYQPDEFSVAVKPELKMPPDMNLRPPTPGQPDRGYVPETVQAQKKLYGQEVNLQATHTKDAEESLLSTAGKDVYMDPNIRQKVNEEAKSEGDLLERLKSMKDKAIKNLTLSDDADIKVLPPEDGDVQVPPAKGGK